MLPSAQMQQLIFRSLDPAPTSPFNPFYGRRDNRSARQQVVSGLRLAGRLVGGILILGVAFWSISTLLADARSNARSGHFVFWVMLCFASLIMFVTVNEWVALVPAFYVLILTRIVGVLIIGTFSSSSTTSDWGNRRDLFELLVVCVVVSALSWRFIGNTPAPTTLLDRFALTFFVLAQLIQTAIIYHWPPLPLTSGLSALLIAWCGYRWKLARELRTRRNGNPINSETLPEP
jgi:hypothetical protein